MSKFFKFEGDETTFNLAHIVSLSPPTEEDGENGEYVMLLVTGEAVTITPGEYLAVKAFITEHCGGIVELEVEEPDDEDEDEEPEADDEE